MRPVHLAARRRASVFHALTEAEAAQVARDEVFAQLLRHPATVQVDSDTVELRQPTPIRSPE